MFMIIIIINRLINVISITITMFMMINIIIVQKLDRDARHHGGRRVGARDELEHEVGVAREVHLVRLQQGLVVRPQHRHGAAEQPLPAVRVLEEQPLGDAGAQVGEVRGDAVQALVILALDEDEEVAGPRGIQGAVRDAQGVAARAGRHGRGAEEPHPREGPVVLVVARARKVHVVAKKPRLIRGPADGDGAADLPGGHAERPQPQKSDLINIIIANCSDLAQ